MIVVDASVVLSWLLAERDDRAVRSAELVLRAGAIVPAIFPLEITNALIVAARRERISFDGAALALEQLSRLPLRVAIQPLAPMLAMALARTYELSAYDAAYLALAKEERLPLHTRDERLARAAKHEHLSSMP